MNREDSLRDQVNESGYPLQLAVEAEVRGLEAKYGWSVQVTEHPWSDSDGTARGFIDLVLSKGGIQRAVVECKRLSDSSLIFLVHPKDRIDQSPAKVLWQRHEPDAPEQVVGNWEDVNLMPASPEADFCVIPSKNKWGERILESTCQTLLASLRRFAAEEFELARNAKLPRNRRFTYLPVIVTTATLHVCRVNSREIDLATGVVETGDFQEVGFVRFRKCFDAWPQAEDTRGHTVQTLHTWRQRTILVVNAAHLGGVLREWEYSSYGIDEDLPWNVPLAKRRAARGQEGLQPNRRLQLSGLSVTPAAYAPAAPDRRPQLKRVSLDVGDKER